MPRNDLFDLCSQISRTLVSLGSELLVHQIILPIFPFLFIDFRLYGMLETSLISRHYLAKAVHPVTLRTGIGSVHYKNTWYSLPTLVFTYPWKLHHPKSSISWGPFLLLVLCVSASIIIPVAHWQQIRLVFLLNEYFFPCFYLSDVLFYFDSPPIVIGQYCLHIIHAFVLFLRIKNIFR